MEEQLSRRERRRLEREQRRNEIINRYTKKPRIGKKAILGVLIIIFIGGIVYAVAFAGKNDPVTGALIQSQKISFEDAVGKTAPDFILEALDGNKVKISDYSGKFVILFFNEGSMCYPACWDQIAALSNDERLNNNNIVSFSIVADPKGEWEKVSRQIAKFANAKILFDTARTVSSSYDVLSLPSSMHKGSYPGHTYVIIDKEGIIRYVLDDPSMAIRNDILVSEIEKMG